MDQPRRKKKKIGKKTKRNRQTDKEVDQKRWGPSDNI